MRAGDDRLATGFKIPSNSIFCRIESDDENDPAARLRCDVTKMPPEPIQKPVPCYPNWSYAFSITQAGSVGIRGCHQGTAKDDRMAILSYGSEWRRKGFTCTLTTEPFRGGRLTCVNGNRHGFALSRTAQTVF
jgi:hypothetical protein